jgi:disulfide bond formation protein DsbB
MNSEINLKGVRFYIMSKFKWFNLALRAIMELGIVLALAYWGYQTGNNLGMKILLGIIAPLVGFGFWGAIDFHQAGNIAEPLRLIEELLISGLAAFALYVVGQHTLGWAFAALSILYHLLVYLSGGRLLKTQSQT